MKRVDPNRPRCMACAQAIRPVSIEMGSAAGWHERCPGWYGGYLPDGPRLCKCGCPTSNRHRGIK